MIYRVFSQAQIYTIVLSSAFLGLATHSSLSARPGMFPLRRAHAPLMNGYGLMSEAKVAAIFHERIPTLSRSKSADLARHFISLCREHRFDPALVLSLIHVESTFQVDAVSPKGAVGLMQLMPATAQFTAKMYKLPYRGRASLFKPQDNLTLGVAYLSYLRDKYRELPPYYHLAAYNLGPARMDQLIAQKNFRPTTTKVYYEKIVNGVPGWRKFRVKPELADRRDEEDRV